MKTVDIYNQIIKTFEEVSRNNNGEVKIVEQSISQIQSLKFPNNIHIQSGFCHQKPYAFF
jgi:hypothetical protein